MQIYSIMKGLYCYILHRQMDSNVSNLFLNFGNLRLLRLACKDNLKQWKTFWTLKAIKRLLHIWKNIILDYIIYLENHVHKLIQIKIKMITS